MKTPNSWNKKLKEGTITDEMLEVALYSVNKRAKNWRDKKREYSIGYDYYNNKEKASSNEKQMYSYKEKMLSLVKPDCIHQEFAGFKRERIYSYEQDFAEKFFRAALNNSIVRCGHFIKRDERSYFDDNYDHNEEQEVLFFDRIDKSNPESRWYLYYIVGNHTFHTPIKEEDVQSFIDNGLKIVKIPTLKTGGDDILELASIQFVKKIITLIDTGKAIYERSTGKRELPNYNTGWDKLDIDIIFTKIEGMIEFIYSTENMKSAIRRNVLKEISNNLCEVPLLKEDLSNIKERIIVKYMQGIDNDVFYYALGADFLKMDNINVSIDYEAARDALKRLEKYDFYSILDCLIPFADKDSLVQQFNDRCGKKLYLQNHWEEIYKNTIDNVTEKQQKQREQAIIKQQHKKKKKR